MERMDTLRESGQTIVKSNAMAKFRGWDVIKQLPARGARHRALWSH
jgi:hypothetical protein